MHWSIRDSNIKDKTFSLSNFLPTFNDIQTWFINSTLSLTFMHFQLSCNFQLLSTCFNWFQPCCCGCSSVATSVFKSRKTVSNGVFFEIAKLWEIARNCQKKFQKFTEIAHVFVVAHCTAPWHVNALLRTTWKDMTAPSERFAFYFLTHSML